MPRAYTPAQQAAIRRTDDRLARYFAARAFADAECILVASESGRRIGRLMLCDAPRTTAPGIARPAFAEGWVIAVLPNPTPRPDGEFHWPVGPLFAAVDPTIPGALRALVATLPRNADLFRVCS